MPTSASARSQMAVFLPTFGAPGCLSYSSSCDTGVSLVAGRYTHGPDFLPEQNNPNTIDGCQDGDYDRNTYYIEWITLRSGGVTQNDSSEPLRSGDRATIVVTSLLGKHIFKIADAFCNRNFFPTTAVDAFSFRVGTE